MRHAKELRAADNSASNGSPEGVLDRADFITIYKAVVRHHDLCHGLTEYERHSDPFLFRRWTLVDFVEWIMT